MDGQANAIADARFRYLIEQELCPQIRRDQIEQAVRDQDRKSVVDRQGCPHRVHRLRRLQILRPQSQ